jgi:lysophospholipid acyltransferase (LPLAT)-like uncharacterized protein
MLKKMWLHVKRNWIPYTVAYAGKYTIRLLLSTCRLKITGFDGLIKAAEINPCILMLWHNRLVIMSEVINKLRKSQSFTVLISKSRDGDPLAILIESYVGGHALRVAHNSRHCALSQLITTLKKEQDIVVITPDGPRGPCYEVKPGIVMAAREAKAQIVPLTWTASRQWQLKTWDRMRIPKPFSTIHVDFGQPIELAEQQQSLECDADMLRNVLMNME